MAKNSKRRHITDVTIGTVHHIGVSGDGTATVRSSTDGQIVIDGRVYEGNTVSIDGDRIWVDGELTD
jgi:hypothetical protein